MTDTEKRLTIEMRRGGYSFGRMAKILGISTGTIKSFCSRNGVTRDSASSENTGSATRCRECDAELAQPYGVKKKLFCSSACRIKWWNKHRNMPGRKSIQQMTCVNCGAVFMSYDAKRKYCNHGCYIARRYGR